jgi:Tol biopolymer transport system component
VFDWQAEDGAGVWTVDVSGSGLRQVIRDPAADIGPSFSRDGRFIYFTSNRTGRNEVWRTPASGGPEELITSDRRGGGWEPALNGTRPC